ncbi:MAG: cytochrome c oxidase subunit II [Planctomycetaceae bacterium]|nr:cytochrome c oxidase subunit II [Planctomycetaceae bacterium]
MKKFWCLFFIFWPLVAALSFIVAPARGWWFPGPAASPLGSQIDDLFYLILVIVSVTFVLVMAAMGYAVWRASHNTEKSNFTHGSHSLEVIWTIVPAGILLFIALYQLDVWAQYRVKGRFPKGVLTAPIAEVTARQFEWRMRYPAPDRKFANEADVQKWLRQPEPGDLHSVNDLHVPTGTPVLIYLRTQDVQHSFFVPMLRVKQDAVPGLVIPVWFEAINEAKNVNPQLQGVVHEWVCAELCGWGHYKMKARVVSQPAPVFRKYLADLQREELDDGAKGAAPVAVVPGRDADLSVAGKQPVGGQPAVNE